MKSIDFIPNETVDKLYEQYQKNSDATDLVNAFLNECYDSIGEKEVSEFKEAGYSLEDGMREQFYSYFLISDSKTRDFLAENISFKCLNSSLVEDNPYHRIVKADERKRGRFSLTYNRFLPYEFFLLDDVKSAQDFYTEKMTIAFFPKMVPYLTLLEGKRIWMSITPYEIKTNEQYIEKAKGDVLAFGLGLGYYPFMCSLKDEVKSVTVIEESQEVIDLFLGVLLDQFPRKDKIKIVKGNCYDYLDVEKYDTIFVDIYHNEEDGLRHYLKMRERVKSKNKLDFWIEETILSYLRRYLIDGLYCATNGIKIENQLQQKIVTKFLNNLKKPLLEEELLSMLSDVELKKLY